MSNGRFVSPFRKQAPPKVPKPDGVCVDIAVPCGNGFLNVALAAFLLQAKFWGMQQDPKIFFYFTQCHGVSPVEYARNRLVAGFLKTPCDWIWFIDADMVPMDNAFRVFEIAEDYDIIGARGWIANLVGEKAFLKLNASVKNPHDHMFTNITWDDAKGEVRDDVDTMGTGCLLVRRKVIEDRRLWLPGEYQDGDGNPCDLMAEEGQDGWAPPIFRTLYKPNGAVVRSEDFDFVWRAKNLGYRLACHLGAGFGHIKTVNLDDVARSISSAGEFCLAKYKHDHPLEVAERERLAGLLEDKTHVG